mgnify:CR=1 FL=1
MADVIPIPAERATGKRPIHIEFPTRAFPGQRFALRMDWNDVSGHWTVELEHLSRDFPITKSVATLYRPYSYMPYLVFMFADPTGESRELTPGNLGEEVEFFVLPGPSGRAPEEED